MSDKRRTPLPTHLPCGCAVIYESPKGIRRTSRHVKVRDDGMRECPHGVWKLKWRKVE